MVGLKGWCLDVFDVDSLSTYLQAKAEIVKKISKLISCDNEVRTLCYEDSGTCSSYQLRSVSGTI